VRGPTTNRELTIVLPAIVYAAPIYPISSNGSTDVWNLDLLNQWMLLWLSGPSIPSFVDASRMLLENNLGIPVLIGVKNSGDLLQGAAILVAEKCHHST
jgi:hypothetical protein